MQHQDQQYGSNLDRVFQLNESPKQASNWFYILINSSIQVFLLAVNLGITLGFHDIITWDVLSLPSQQVHNLIPFDPLATSIFLMSHLTVTEYIGRCELDRAQYLAIRALPFLTVFVSLFTSMSPPEYKLILGFIACVHLLYFILIDWERAVTSPFQEIYDEFGEDEVKTTKKVVIENNGHRLRMIIYRENKDGGIQGILMEFYFDIQTGMISNEFLRIVEKEDGQVELVKVESGVRKLEDRREIERVFKKLFLKNN